MVGILTIEIISGLSVIISAELTTLRGVVITAHRSEYAVTKHCHKERANFVELILKSIIVNCLNAYGGEIVGFAVHISFCADNTCAVRTNKVFQTAGSVHHVLHTGNPVVGLHVSDLTALRVDPDHAFTQMEGVGQTVIRYGVIRSKSRLLNIFHIILIQTVISLDDLFGVSFHRGCKSIPSYGVTGVRIVVLVREFVALGSEVFLNPSLEGTGLTLFAPSGTDFVDFGLLKERIALNDNLLMITLVIRTPKGAVNRTGSDTRNRVVTATALKRNHNGGTEHLSLGDSHQGITLCKVFARNQLFRRKISFIEVAKHIFVNLCRLCVIGFCIVTTGLGRSCRTSVNRHLFCTTGKRKYQNNRHYKSQKSCDCFFHFVFLL